MKGYWFSCFDNKGILNNKFQTNIIYLYINYSENLGKLTVSYSSTLLTDI